MTQQMKSVLDSRERRIEAECQKMGVDKSMFAIAVQSNWEPQPFESLDPAFENGKNQGGWPPFSAGRC